VTWPVSGRWLGPGGLCVRVVALTGTQRLWATWAGITADVDVAVCVTRRGALVGYFAGLEELAAVVDLADLTAGLAGSRGRPVVRSAGCPLARPPKIGRPAGTEMCWSASFSAAHKRARLKYARQPSTPRNAAEVAERVGVKPNTITSWVNRRATASRWSSAPAHVRWPRSRPSPTLWALIPRCPALRTAKGP
jgi:hypothetical protein